MLKYKILITGGSGFIGAHLTEKLLSLGHKVLNVDLLRTQGGIPFVNKKSKFIKGSISNKRTILKIKKWKPQIIYHLAAQSASETAYDDPKFDILTNCYGTYLVSELAKKLKVKKFIYTSSVAVYGNSKNTLEEDSKIDPDSIYGVSKYASELFIKQNLKGTSTEIIIFRVCNTYGPGENLNNQKKGMISIYSSYIWKKKPILIKGSLNRFRNFMYVDDCANILAKALKIKIKNNLEVINLSFGDKYKVKELIKLIIKASGKKSYKYHKLNQTPGDSFGFHASGKKLKKIFKLKSFKKLEEGLRCYFNWINKIPINSKLKKYHPYQIAK